MNGDERLLQEHLLTPSTPAPSNSSSPRKLYTPLRYFFSREADETGEIGQSTRVPIAVTPQRDNTDELGMEDNDSDPPIVDEALPPEKEIEIQMAVLRILGRPYASQRSFWWQALPRAIILGVVLAVTMLGFFYALNHLTSLWWSIDDFSIENPRGEWRWLIITSCGGLVSGLLLLVPVAPPVGAVRTMFHDATDLRGIVIEAPFVVMACMACLATGAPLGPEMALGAIGSGVASWIARFRNNSRRLEAACVVSGMAGALGALFPSPMLGVLLVHELSVIGRPSNMTLNQVASPVSTSSGLSSDHDFMEQVTLMGTSATVSYVVLRLLVSSSHLPWTTTVDLGSDYEMWHLAAAIPMGLLSGLVGCVAMILLGFFRSVRQLTFRVLHQYLGFPQWIGPLLFPVLAGVLHGLLAYYNAFLVGSGGHLAGTLLSAFQDGHLSVRWLAMTGFCKIVSMAVSLGFGLVGGPLMPMTFIGLCLGLGMSTVLPLAVAVPCCTCAVVCSMVSIPFTAVFTATIGFSLTAEQMGPVFVCTFVAYTLTGGIGFIRTLGEKGLGGIASIGPLADDLDSQGWIGDEAEYWYRKLPSDNSVVRGVRSTIFGQIL